MSKTNKRPFGKAISTLKQPTLSFGSSRDLQTSHATEEELNKIRIETARHKKQKVLQAQRTERSAKTNTQIQQLLYARLLTWLRTSSLRLDLESSALDEFVTKLSDVEPYTITHLDVHLSMEERQQLQRIGAEPTSKFQVWQVKKRADLACVLRNVSNWLPSSMVEVDERSALERGEWNAKPKLSISGMVLARLVEYADSQWMQIAERVHLTDVSKNTVALELAAPLELQSTKITTFEALLSQVRYEQARNQTRIELEIPSSSPEELLRLQQLGVPPEAADLFDGLRKLGPHASCSNAARLARGLKFGIVSSEDVCIAYNRLKTSPNTHSDVLTWLMKPSYGVSLDS